MTPGLAVFPGPYLYHTRLQAPMEQLSWVLINPVVIVGFSFAITDLPLGVSGLALVLGWIAFQSVYEVGYIVNDVETTSREPMPTQRLAQEDKAGLASAMRLVVAAKLGLAGAAFAGLVVLDEVVAGALSLKLFAGALAATLLLYAVHNTVRSRANIGTYFGLSWLKYAAVPALVYSGPDWGLLCVAAALVFPLVRTVEYGSQRKFGLVWLARRVGHFDRFRPLYYAAASVVMGATALLTRLDMAVVGLVMTLYMFAIRILGLWVAHRLDRTNSRGHTAD